MGIFYYGEGHQLELDDRTLAHLQAVIMTKLRRSESFALSWEHPLAAGSGRTSVWLNPAVPIRFALGGRAGGVNREWIGVLAAAADRGELTIIPEPATPGPSADAGPSAGGSASASAAHWRR
ncbi:ATP-dependent DNA ligase [Herbiconiux sp. A18JL235]|uniref:ATP-dependent DNA ligase n=1 Tax=Herbiconiux sp. A18JL235 TaxID=3152363 RepID=A0AB39BE75_9MICO